MTDVERGIRPIYTATGRVVHGRGIGKLVGTPTANLEADENTPLPETGVYVSQVRLEGQMFCGVTHVGLRPTLDHDAALWIETYIFSFDRDIYGATITINLYQKLREVKKFQELSLLLRQIEADCSAARKFWGIKPARQPLRFDIQRHCVMIGPREVVFSTKEFEVFYLLYASPQTTFTKEQIYELVWREPTNGHLHPVENTIFQIRKRLKSYGLGHEYIKTVIGCGYRFNPW